MGASLQAVGRRAANVYALADRRLDALRRRRVPERRRHPVRRLPPRVRPEHRRRARRLVARTTASAGRSYALAADSNGHAVRRRRVQRPRRHPGRRLGRLLRRRRVARDGLGPGPSGGARQRLRPQPHRERDDVYVGTRRRRHRGHPAGRPRREVERLGVERARLEHRRQERLVFPPATIDLRARRPRARASSPAGRSRTRTATRSPTTSSSSTGRRGSRSARTAPATAR